MADVALPQPRTHTFPTFCIMTATGSADGLTPQTWTCRCARTCHALPRAIQRPLVQRPAQKRHQTVPTVALERSAAMVTYAASLSVDSVIKSPIAMHGIWEDGAAGNTSTLWFLHAEKHNAFDDCNPARCWSGEHGHGCSCIWSR